MLFSATERHEALFNIDTEGPISAVTKADRYINLSYEPRKPAFMVSSACCGKKDSETY
jgi:hypothetical protein